MPDDPDPLRGLVAGIERAGLRVPVALLLEMLSPFDVISSQMARFGRPLAGGTPLEPVLGALAEAAAWADLRRRIGRQD